MKCGLFCLRVYFYFTLCQFIVIMCWCSNNVGLHTLFLRTQFPRLQEMAMARLSNCEVFLIIWIFRGAERVTLKCIKDLNSRNMVKDLLI